MKSLNRNVLISFSYFVEQYRLKPKFAEKEHAGCIKCAANSGTILVTGSSDETIRYGRCLKIFFKAGGKRESVQFMCFLWATAFILEIGLHV